MPPFGEEMERNDKLIAFLRANRHGERIFVAGPASMEMGPIIVKTGETAVSLGGFMGSDPVLTKDEFAKMVEDGEIRFVLIGGGPGGGPPPGGMFGGGPPGGMPLGPPGGGPPGGPGGPGDSEVAVWVREHGTVVDSKLWEPQEKSDETEPESPNTAPFGLPGGPPGGIGGFFRRMRRMAKLYDCKPAFGLVTTDEDAK